MTCHAASGKDAVDPRQDAYPFPSQSEHNCRQFRFQLIDDDHFRMRAGSLRQRGLEVSIDHRFSDTVSGYANYSYQGDPKKLSVDSGTFRLPTPGEAKTLSSRFFNAVTSSRVWRTEANRRAFSMATAA